MVRIAFCCLVLLPLAVMAQTTAYGPLEKLPSTVNSSYEESLPHLSPDGTTLYFTRLISPDNIGGQYAGADVWASRYDVTTIQWGKADNRRMNINSSGNNSIIGISRAGDVIYQLRTSSASMVPGIYFSKRDGNAWTKPELIPIEGIYSQGFLGAYISPDADVLFLSMQGDDSRGQEDLYVSVKNSYGVWSIPKNLGPTINTSGFELSPFLSPDKKRLYFSSNGHGGEGDADVFYSDRLYDSWEAWSLPKNLGTAVNSKAFEGYYAVYGDTVAYFASNRDGKTADIFRTKVTVSMPKFLVLDKPEVKDAVVLKTDSVAGEELPLTEPELVKLFGLKVDTNIKFDKASFTMRSDSKELLFFMVNKISQRKDLTIRVVGHSDNTGSEGFNLELARRRANTIRDFLIENGLDNHTMKSEGVLGGIAGVVEIWFYKK